MATKIAAPQRPATTSRPTRAERLVSAFRALPDDELRGRIESARALTNDELVERQKQERRERAEAAAARLRSR